MSEFSIQEVKIGYNFPYNNGGDVCGINDSGIETFRDNPISSLTKETIQNSLDARLPKSTEPVTVKFNLTYIQRDNFPYIDQFNNMLNCCKNFDDNQNNPKALSAIEKATDILSKPTIPILEISDFNTTGLKGAGQTRNSNFNNLVKSSGVSNKADDAGGSFGIGKNAPFACSLLRFVIYSTIDEDNTKALQGVMQWTTHLHNNRQTQGRGYLGITNKLENGDYQNLPFIDSDFDEAEVNIADYFIRKDIGTSVFVMGFFDEENWKTSIIKSTIESYFIAISEGKLKVFVDGFEISKDTLSSTIKKYFNPKDDILTMSYYESLSSKPIIAEFSDIIPKCDIRGEVKLYLLHRKDLPRRVAYVRSNGMKIIDKDRFRVPQQFSGVLKFEGKDVNKFIRSLENPAHDKINVKILQDNSKEKEATRILNALSKWITDIIKENSDINIGDTLNIDWLSRTLPGKMDNTSQIEVKESIHKSIIDIMHDKITTVRRGKRVTSDHVFLGEDRPKNPTNRPNPKPTTDDGITKPTKEKNIKLKPIEIKRSRVFSPGNTNNYIALVESNNSCNTYLELRIVGEDGKSEECNLKSVKYANGENIEIKKHSIFGPIKFKKNEKKKFEIEILNSSKCALEVLSYENDI